MLAIKARIMLDKLVSSLRKEEGQGLVEYGLILALVAVVVVGALTTMGQNLLAKLQVVVTNLV